MVFKVAASREYTVSYKLVEVNTLLVLGVLGDLNATFAWLRWLLL